MQDVVKLLQSAGLAVRALTQPQVEADAEGNEATGFADRKASFTAAASQYFNTLSSIDIHLRRQINALEEARIIPAETTAEGIPNTLAGPLPNLNTASSNPAQVKQAMMRKGAITGGGLGSLDVGWLNSRNDKVGKEMEAELWEKAQQLVEAFETSKKDGTIVASDDC